MIGSPEKQALMKIVLGVLRSNVQDHGSTVEGSWLGSAAKRICNQILAADNLKVEYIKARKHRVKCPSWEHVHSVPECCHEECWCREQA